MTNTISELVMQIAEPIAKSFDLELVEVEYTRKSNGMNLTIFIDKIGGVSLEDCEKLHHAIDLPLDELNPTNDAPYTLNVSSLGLDRPLKTERDFQRNLNKEIIVKLYSAEKGKKVFEGVLVSFDNEKFELKTINEIKTFYKEKVAHIEPLIRF